MATVIRLGRPVKADEVFKAWMSADIDRMTKALPLRTNPIDRHFLLLNLCQKAYALRKTDLTMRELARRVGRLHVQEFASLAAPLWQDMGGIMPRVPTFQNLATLLTEDGEFAEAISVCETAQKYGLTDGTKGGFPERIECIRRKAAKAADRLLRAPYV